MAKLRILSRYGVAPNNLINNPNITLKAKGMFLYIQSKPDGWEFSISRASKQLKEGKEAIRGAIMELEIAGFLTRSARKTQGRYDGYDYNLTENPTTENPTTGNSTTENPDTFIKKEVSKKETVRKKYNTVPQFLKNKDEILSDALKEYTEEYGANTVQSVFREFCEKIQFKDYKYKNYKLALYNWIRNHDKFSTQKKDDWNAPPTLDIIG